MSDKKQNQFDSYKNALILSNKDNAFNDFINSLTDLELEAYFYIEAKRIQCFLAELDLIKENENQSYNERRSSHLIKSSDDFHFIMDFCKTCSDLPKPRIELRKRIIDKHKHYLRELSEEEMKFFLEC